MKMFEEIVFMQGEDAYEAMNILDEKGPEALLEHLLQWDNDSCTCSENPPWGTGDQVMIFPKGDHELALSYNTGLSYCGLCRIWKWHTLDPKYYAPAGFGFSRIDQIECIKGRSGNMDSRRKGWEIYPRFIAYDPIIRKPADKSRWWVFAIKGVPMP